MNNYREYLNELSFTDLTVEAEEVWGLEQGEIDEYEFDSDGLIELMVGMDESLTKLAGLR